MTVGQIVGEGPALQRAELSAAERDRLVLALLADLQHCHGPSYVFISHDLVVMQAMSHRVMVMEDGDVIEEGEAEALFDAPRELCTRVVKGKAAHLA